MILPKNAASLISESLSTSRKGAEGASEVEQPMDEMEALGQSILDAIKSGDARSVGESFRSFYEACANMPPAEEPLPEDASLADVMPHSSTKEG